MNINTASSESKIINNFLNYSILEAQSFRSKLRNKLEVGSTPQVAELKAVYKELNPAFLILDSYYSMINSILAKSEKNSSAFNNVFFQDKVKEVRELILQLYPQSMPLYHYAELFDLCGYAPHIDFEKVSQITIKRLYAYQKFQVINKEIYLQDEYTFGELHGVVRPEKIKEIVDEYWKEGRLEALEFIAFEKGGRLISDQDKLKVFEIETDQVDELGNKIYCLVYLTPSFYSYNPEDLFNKQKGEYFFVNEEPRISTCLVSFDRTFFRHHFVKPIGDSSEMRFNLNIKLPINLFRFKVTKPGNSQK